MALISTVGESPQISPESIPRCPVLLFRTENNILMAGHSHWKNIQYRKSRQDAIKNIRNNKISLEISAAVRAGGADPKNNPRLSLVLQRAKSAHFPKEKIEAAIQSGLGKTNEGAECVIYEGYGPGGTAIVIETMTNNRNRTAQRLRIVFNKYGGSLASSGCVSWMFKKKGLLVFKCEPSLEEKILEAAMEAGAEDFKKDEDIKEIKIYCEVSSLLQVREMLEKKGFVSKRAMIINVPTQINELPDEETAESLRKLIDAFEEVDEVVTVIHNAGTEEDDYIDDEQQQ
jgi:YebC/PmpR family DNA-binding regulatory protein